MARRVFVDFHHSSLLTSLVLLFEERLGMEVYRPIGLDWFLEDYWAVNNQLDTAEQFLSMDQAYHPDDGTPALNRMAQKSVHEQGTCKVLDPGGKSWHSACTLDYFKNNQFDYVVASIPAHVPIFKRLIAEYQPNAKLIVQMGNNWNLMDYAGYNVLASVAPQFAPGVNVQFYHQEFSRSIFHPTENKPTRQIHSFINVIQNAGIGWNDYTELARLTKSLGFEWRAYGGQCPDGNMNGPHELAEKMREAMMIFHVKPGGDGFGHIIHNAYAVGRPVITRSSHYRGQLAEQLLVPGTFIDLDKMGRPEVKNVLHKLCAAPEMLAEMGRKAATQFDNVVNWAQEAKEVWQWLEQLN